MSSTILKPMLIRYLPMHDLCHRRYGNQELLLTLLANIFGDTYSVTHITLIALLIIHRLVVSGNEIPSHR